MSKSFSDFIHNIEFNILDVLYRKSEWLIKFLDIITCLDIYSWIILLPLQCHPKIKVIFDDYVQKKYLINERWFMILYGILSSSKFIRLSSWRGKFRKHCLKKWMISLFIRFWCLPLSKLPNEFSIIKLFNYFNYLSENCLLTAHDLLLICWIIILSFLSHCISLL